MPSNQRKESSEDTSPQEHLAGMAEHTLGFITETAASALDQLSEKPPQSANVLAVVNSVTSEKAMRNLDAIGHARVQELRVLSKEPAIARIVVAEETGDTKTYFISRGTPTRPPRDGSAVAGGARQIHSRPARHVCEHGGGSG